MSRKPLAFVLLLFAASAWGYDVAPRRPVDLSGDWVLNERLSDDVESLLNERLEKERRRYEREWREELLRRPPGEPPDLDVEAQRGALRPWQKQRRENFRRMLAATQTLHIEQSGASLTFTSALDSRRVSAGSRTQVSMPEGQLADSRVGWDGERFVIERNVRRGPRVVEKFRLLKTGQLEYTMAWGGDSELAGLKVRRIFERSSAAVTRRSPEMGPVR